MAVFIHRSSSELRQVEQANLTLALFGALFLDGGPLAVKEVLHKILRWPPRRFIPATDLFDLHLD